MCNKSSAALTELLAIVSKTLITARNVDMVNPKHLDTRQAIAEEAYLLTLSNQGVLDLPRESQQSARSSKLKASCVECNPLQVCISICYC